MVLEGTRNPGQPIAIVAGARPNFMKIAPLVRAFRERSIPYELIHTGQHYDKKMSEIFFEELDIPKPDISLGVGSGSQAEQTGRTMIAFEEHALQKSYSWVVVVGDVNSTVACSLVAAKLGIPVAHLEAGLRSHDWLMPEEVNRVVTDRLSTLLLTPSQDGDENLRAEGVPEERISFVGNIMIDTLLRLLPKAEERTIVRDLSLESRGYCVGTFHRPSNVDGEEKLQELCALWEKVTECIPLVLPLHPRTRNSLERFDLMSRCEDMPGLHLLEPLGYLDFLALNREARVVLTDSGGIQEETTVLGVPCLTYRENTERPVTITHGTNQLVGSDPKRALEALHQVLKSDLPQLSPPPLWDGKAGERIAELFSSRM
ncbi:UDP-N-acetylglucosamine 2-epimerase (non-hydrolyzing) [bacterium]|nr:UDP-N-acetylglucosamine 2-epimerase (non-hydrolyzing) [bacterium]